MMIKTTLKIEGMMCPMCEAHINTAIRNNFKIKKISSDHKKGVTEIISENSLNEAELKNYIEEEGYRLIDVKSEEFIKKGLFARNK